MFVPDEDVPVESEGALPVVERHLEVDDPGTHVVASWSQRRVSRAVQISPLEEQPVPATAGPHPGASEALDEHPEALGRGVALADDGLVRG